MNKTLIIAEAGVNHNGSVELAMQLIDAAAAAGADAVKFQTFRADKFISRNAPKAEYQNQNTDKSESQFEMIKNLELDETSHKVLMMHCQKRGIQFLSTPFDVESLDMLAYKFDLPLLKVPSGEITNAPLLLKAAQTGKRIILSTGMCTLEEIKMALGVLAFGYLGSKERPSLNAFQKAYDSLAEMNILHDKVTLLHCTTEYPAPFEEVNLLAMDTLHSEFSLPVGYSDHTTGIAVAIAAVARGASIIEKHFTLDKKLSGPDHKASLEPQELKDMVKAIRQVELSLGLALKVCTASEKKNIAIARKSLVAARDIRKGELYSDDNITAKRPGDGISPMYYWDMLGKAAEKDFAQDEKVI